MKRGRTASTPRPSTAELAVREFVRAWGLFHDAMKPYFRSFGISGAQWGVLRTLQRADDAGLSPLRLTDLGRRLLVRPPSVTSVVDRLERMHLVARRPSRSDRRAKEIVLTAAGRKLVLKVLRHHPRQMRCLLGSFSPAETRAVQRLMGRMADHLQTLPAARESSEAPER